MEKSILELNDECLLAIFEKMGRVAQGMWSRVCKRFAKIYCEYYIHKLIIQGYDDTLLDDRFVQIFGHLIGTELFPLKDIKSLKFDETCSIYYNKFFFNMLRHDHPSIERIELYGFLDKDINNLLPLPNVKRLHFKYTTITGKHLDQLQTLEELKMEGASSFESKQLLVIAKNNRLRKLIIRNSPVVFAPKHALEIVGNLKYIEELELNWNEIRQYQVLGALPRLKALVINDFKTFQCPKCKEFDRGVITRPTNANNFGMCNCGPYEAKFLFRALAENTKMEQLIFIGYRLTTRDLKHISQLTSLKILYLAVDNLPVYISLAIFGKMRHLEVLDLGFSWKLPKDALELLKNCENLKFANFGNCEGFKDDFILKAIDIVKSRTPTSAEPIRLQLLNADIEKEFLEEEHVKAAESWITFYCYMQSEQKIRLGRNNYYQLAC
ncbi:uncharacterized protein LOC118747900 [Rhagoletis pomonella]|uniref:uncharacterized protein LOC118747900 n=1 Tax=Rhagoletis pomonella TaxID=28610 RepID=UPI001785D8C9|nr:uncharacterized protein LOC118747900 [Rhagoletis pomonella]